MRCTFPTCDHDSNQNLSSGISFHRFPGKASLRLSWMKALGQTDWEPEPCSIICSEHFLDKDFLQTTIECQIQNNNLDHDYSMKLCNGKVCRICLATDGKMCSLAASKALNEAYETLTGILTADEEQLPRYVCTECADRLMNCARFRRRSLHAHSMLLDVARRHGRITVELVRSIEMNSFNSDQEGNPNDGLGINDEDFEEVNDVTDISNDTKLEDNDMCNINDFESQMVVTDNSHVNSEDKANNIIAVNDIKIENDDLSNQDDFDGCLSTIKVEVFANDAVESDLIDDISVRSFLNKDIDGHINNDGIKNVTKRMVTSGTQYVNDEVIQNKSLVCTTRWNEDIVSNDTNIERSDEDSLFVEKSYSDYTEYGPSFINSGKNILSDPLRTQGARRIAKRVTETSQDLNKIKNDNHPTGIPSGRKPHACDICTKVFLYNCQLKSHLLTHSDEKPYSCDVCGKGFRRKRLVRLHYLSIHSKEKPFSCDICSKVFSHGDALNAHLNGKHSTKKLYSCNICDKGFIYKNRLKVHSVVHTGERPYSCNICKKAFTHKNVLTSHIKTHSDEKPYKCRICDKSLKSKGSLRCHLRLHTGERPYSCDICKKAFYYKQHLETHITIHTDVKQYSCEICKKALKTRRTLQRHLRTHLLIENHNHSLNS